MSYSRRVTRTVERVNLAAKTIRETEPWSKAWFNALHSYLSWVSKMLAFYYADDERQKPLPEFRDSRRRVPAELLDFYAQTITDPRIAAWFRK